MAKKEELFVLIKSLSRSEKRHFKLYSTHSKDDANYIRLFDAIDKQEVYNEALIKKHFSNEPFIKQLHVTKYYLRDMILAALRSFHNSISKDAELKEVLRNVELLFNKELYGLCETELTKAEHLAERYELSVGMVELLSWKRKLKQAMEPYNYDAFLTTVQEQKKAIDTLQNSNDYWKEMILQTWQTLGNTQPPEKITITKLKHAVTLDTKVLKHNTAYIRYLREGKSKQGKTELTKLIELLEQHPHRLKEEPAPYISTINNLTSYYVFSKRDNEALALINKAKNMYESFKLTTEKKSLLKQVLRTYNIELEIYRDKSKKNKPDFNFVAETEKFLHANRNKIPKDYMLSLWFQLAHIHFTHGRYNDALKWLNNILNNKFGKRRMDLQKSARMLNLLVHFEQKNFFVLRYFVDSAKRFVKKNSEVTQYDDLLFRFFVKASNTPEYEHRAIYKELYNSLFPKNNDALIPDNVLDYIDYREWLHNKLKMKHQ